MSSWIIPIVVQDVVANPRPSPPWGPGYPNRKFGLIGVLRLSQVGSGYEGTLTFTKPASLFAGESFSIASQYITYTNNILTVTVPAAAGQCQVNFAKNGNYNPPGQGPGNPASFDTASVNAQGKFTAGNISLPDFTFQGTWDSSANTISNGMSWLPYRYLWAIWGNNNPNQSQTPWGNINLSLLYGYANSTNAGVFSLVVGEYVTIDWGVTGMELVPIEQYITLEVNLTGTTLAANQGMALNISCLQSSGQNSSPLTVLISANKTSWTTVPAGFDASVKQQCFYIPANLIPSTNPFYLKIQNNTSTNVVVSAAQLLY